MDLNIDMSGKDAVVTRRPTPKTDQSGTQRLDKDTGAPRWSTQVVVTDRTGGEIISVNTTSETAPDVEVGDEVELIGLIAKPWFSNGRAGNAFVADEIKVIE